MIHSEFLNLIRRFAGFAAGDLYSNALILELVFWIIVSLVCLLFLLWRPKWLDRFEQLFTALARRRRLAIVGVGVLALALRLSLMPWLPIPVPTVHDEYSYVLGAETFAAGHLSNPAHPLWVHFESFHINAFPSYQSMYPPGQAAVLALGIVLFGNPWWGAWLSIALMCAIVTWMLQGWMRPQWALLGGLFCVLRFATFSYWMNSYWGGAVAATGGALLMGALPRLLHKRTAVHALLLAFGLVVLAATRPYEGLVFSIPAMMYLVARIYRTGSRGWRLGRLVAPALAVLILFAAFQLCYNWRNTGGALTMPYMLNQRTYHITKPFIWQSASPIPAYRHRVMRTFYILQELPNALNARSAWGIEEIELVKVVVYYEFFLWPLLLLTIFAARVMIKSRHMRLFPVTLLLFFVSLLLETWNPNPHYAAPILCVTVATVLYGLRLLRTWAPRRVPVGLMASRAIVLLILAWSVFPLAQRMIDPWQQRTVWPSAEVDGARIQAQLERTPGEHLVIVRNRVSGQSFVDWVYNKPDIDGAKVVWARDMGPDKNEELVRYFANRHIWIVDQDAPVRCISAYLTGPLRTVAAVPATEH